MHAYIYSYIYPYKYTFIYQMNGIQKIIPSQWCRQILLKNILRLFQDNYAEYNIYWDAKKHI